MTNYLRHQGIVIYSPKNGVKTGSAQDRKTSIMRQRGNNECYSSTGAYALY
jgi:hypothetical protein